MNGTTGWATALYRQTGRYAVQLQDGRVVSLKLENLTLTGPILRREGAKAIVLQELEGGSGWRVLLDNELTIEVPSSQVGSSEQTDCVAGLCGACSARAASMC